MFDEVGGTVETEGRSRNIKVTAGEEEKELLSEKAVKEIRTLRSRMISAACERGMGLEKMCKEEIRKMVMEGSDPVVDPLHWTKKWFAESIYFIDVRDIGPSVVIPEDVKTLLQSAAGLGLLPMAYSKSHCGGVYLLGGVQLSESFDFIVNMPRVWDDIVKDHKELKGMKERTDLSYFDKEEEDTDIPF